MKFKIRLANFLTERIMQREQRGEGVADRQDVLEWIVEYEEEEERMPPTMIQGFDYTHR